MISILTSINDNISSLTGMLKARGLLDENKEKDIERAIMQEDVTTDITFSNMDQDGQKKQEHMAKEINKAYKVVEMMQELKKKTDD